MSNTKSTKIIREFEPVNLEFPFESLNSPVTPNDSFYVRNHFPQPHIDPGSWTLSIEGAVSRPYQLTYEELITLPSQSVTALLECAGNSRVFLSPKVAGAQWGLGAVGCAVWKGVPLSLILDRAEVKEDVIDIVFEGADQGIPEEKPKPLEPMHYSRSLPRKKAADRNIILAYQMNDQPLSESHGFPLRLLVPGWYGMASVKWLKRIVATNYEFDGYFQKIDYAYWVQRDGLAVREPITELEVKSEIARPAAHDVVSKNTFYRIHGAAWSSNHPIEKVEVSVNGGKDWKLAKLESENKQHSWVLWNFEWQTPDESGERVLMSRATDVAGHCQPLERDPNRGTYRISHVLSIPVYVG